MNLLRVERRERARQKTVKFKQAMVEEQNLKVCRVNVFSYSFLLCMKLIFQTVKMAQYDDEILKCNCFCE